MEKNRILLLEDDNSLIDGLQYSLEKNGFQLQAARSLEEGRRHLCLYDTGYGTLSVGVFTSSLRSSLGERGGRVHIKYTLDIDSNLSSSNEITVDVKPRVRAELEI